MKTAQAFQRDGAQNRAIGPLQKYVLLLILGTFSV